MMINQQLKLALRSISKGRVYSIISVAGLGIAIAVVLLISVLIRHETSFDKDFAHADRIYRLNWQNQGTGDRFATMMNPTAPQLMLDFAEVEEAARLGIFRLMLQRLGHDGADPGPKNYESMALVDPTFFSLFDLKFLAGDASALERPNSIVMTRAGADRYFPDQDPMGQSLQLEDSLTVTVVGVLAELPRNSHFTSHYFMPLETARTLYDGAGWLDSWGSDSTYHYIRLAEGVDPLWLEAQTPAFLARHSGREDGGVGIQLQALTEIHFTTDLQNEAPLRDNVLGIVKAPRKSTDLLLFSAGAFFLVLVASFNFMNLQVARSVGRGKQVGMLKVLGASRRRVIEQLLLESVLLCMLALILALILVDFSIGGFSQLLAVSVGWGDFLNPLVAGVALLLTLGLGLASGAYPAYLMASQKPAQVMKGEFKLGLGAARVRSALVLLQFAASIALIVMSAVIYAQIRFSMLTPLGFEPENVAVVALDGRASPHFDTLRTRLEQDHRVEHVSRGSIIPTGNLSDGTAFTPPGADEPLAMRIVATDYDYFDALGIEIAAGRAYAREFPADAFVFPTPEAPHSDASIIINEAAARRAGWGTNDSSLDAAIGQVMHSSYTWQGVDYSSSVTIVGIARDVHFRSTRSEVVPMAYFLGQRGGNMVVRFDDQTPPQEANGLIEQIWKETVAELPLRSNWMEERVEDLYSRELRTMKLVAAIAVLAIAVASMGLLAMATLATRLRTREVGLRKVLGASNKQIVNLLSWQFLKPVLLANLLAWPVAWLSMSNWLELFVYRVDLSWVHFLIPGVVTALLAWATIVGQSWWVARASPIYALRHE